MRLIILGFLGLCLAMTGCQAFKSYTYPDSTSPKFVAKTYFEAARTGDLITLEKILGGHMASEFRLYRNENGDEMVRKWYQKDMSPATITIDEIHTSGSNHAYIDLSISHQEKGLFRVQIATIKKFGKWVVTGAKNLED